MFKEYVKFFKENKAFFVSTCVLTTPECRPFGAISCDDNYIYIATNKKKKVYNEICLNPNIQLVSLRLSDRKWIRISARCTEEEKIDKKELLFNENPILFQRYDGINDEKLCVLRLTVTKLETF